VDRILEFSRTIGLCNYVASSKRGVSVSLASRLDSDSEPGVGVVRLARFNSP